MIEIYHNPRCGKSREGLQILEQSGKDFIIVKYLEEIPSLEKLSQIIKFLKIKPLEIVRQNEKIWKDNFKNSNLSDDELIQIMTKHPILIERPIVINGTKAIVGRPPSKILEII